jgi:Sugar kinases, ribokinase family
MADTAEALIVGHLCLDLIPSFISGGGSVSEIFIPGKLININGMSLANGGAASNTGQAMHRLGFKVKIVGKIGDDFIGKAILDNLANVGEDSVRDMIVSPGESSSFTVILNPPGIDRIFLHAEATNSTFKADELPESALDGIKLMHFGYPPLMTSFCVDKGVETKKMLRRARGRNIVTSLDMARPDPVSIPGKVDWQEFLVEVLPFVDVFLPSIDEIIYMLDRQMFDEILKKAGNENMATFIDMTTVRSCADRLLGMGPAIVGFKLGDQGFYLKTSAEAGRFRLLSELLGIRPEEWVANECAIPCFKVDVAGTTGAGDSTIAGFLGALLKRQGPEQAVLMAVAAGGSSVEELDSYSGVKHWEETRARIAAGWPQANSRLIPGDWRRKANGIFAP